MLIDPETFYETNIEGKNENEIRKIIRGLKSKIGRMKNQLENPTIIEISTMDPSDDVKIFCYREYLKRAILTLKDLGIEYKLSKNEARANKFQENIEYIEKITIYNGGFFNQNPAREITFDGDKVVFADENFNEIIVNDLYFGVNKTAFLENLKNLYIGEWRGYYDTKRFNYYVCDGTQWSLKIEYNNGSKPFDSAGSNSYPYNFRIFKELTFTDCYDEDEEDECDDDNED